MDVSAVVPEKDQLAGILNTVVLKLNDLILSLYHLSTSTPSFPCSLQASVPQPYPYLYPTHPHPILPSDILLALKTYFFAPTWTDDTDEEEEEEEPPPRQKRKHSAVVRKPGTPRNSATVCDNMYLPPIIFIHCFNGKLPCVAVPHM